MKKLILTIFASLISVLSFACDCIDINPILEFYSSEYVFEGKIISKVYAKDSLTYKVTFDIYKHYKNGDSPKILDFDITTEGKYTGQWNSCEWSAEKNENWLVYAYLDEGKLAFSGICSNSKVIDKRPISFTDQRLLDNSNSFKIEDYIFENEYGFNYCVNITDIKSILDKGKIKDYKNPTTILNLSIDSNGNLKSVNRQSELIRKKDPIFDLITEVEYNNREPITDFEKDAIELIRQVEKWEIKRHEKTGVNVPYIRHIWVYYDEKTTKWSYDL